MEQLCARQIVNVPSLQKCNIKLESQEAPIILISQVWNLQKVIPDNSNKVK